MSRSLYISCSIAIWLVTCLACMAMLTNWAAAADPVDFEPLLHRQPAVSFAAAEFRSPPTSAPPLSFAALRHRQDAREPADPPAAARPAAPVVIAPAGSYCVGGQCYLRPPKFRGRKGK